MPSSHNSNAPRRHGKPTNLVVGSGCIELCYLRADLRHLASFRRTSPTGFFNVVCCDRIQFMRILLTGAVALVAKNWLYIDGGEIWGTWGHVGANASVQWSMSHYGEPIEQSS